MHKRSFLWAGAAILALGFLGTPNLALANGPVVVLPAPDTSGGRPLMACLKDRKTDRRLTGEDLPLPDLSSLLWAAWGVNRPDGRHVVPTARNEQKVMLFVVLSDGVWQYTTTDSVNAAIARGSHIYASYKKTDKIKP